MTDPEILSYFKTTVRTVAAAREALLGETPAASVPKCKHPHTVAKNLNPDADGIGECYTFAYYCRDCDKKLVEGSNSISHNMVEVYDTEWGDRMGFKTVYESG